MTSCKLVPVGAAAWGDALARVRHDTYHLPAYARIDASQRHADAKAFIFEDRRGVFLLPLLLRTIPGSSRLDATAPHGYGGPVSSCRDTAFWVDTFSALVIEMRDQNVAGLVTPLHPLLFCPSLVFGENSALVDGGSTLSIDLRRSEVEILGELRRRPRHQVPSLEQGLRVAVDEWNYLGAFVDAYYETMDRAGAGVDVYFSSRYFDQIRELLGAHAHLMVVLRNSEFLGGALLFETDGIVQHHLGATRNSARRYQPTKVLFQELSRWAKARGNTDLHFGDGISRDVGCGRRHPLRSVRIVIDPIAYRAYAPRPSSSISAASAPLLCRSGAEGGRDGQRVIGAPGRLSLPTRRR